MTEHDHCGNGDPVHPDDEYQEQSDPVAESSAEPQYVRSRCTTCDEPIEGERYVATAFYGEHIRLATPRMPTLRRGESD